MITKVCAWCGKGKDRAADPSQVSHGICDECRDKHFPEASAKIRAHAGAKA